MKYILLIFMIICSAICKANAGVLTNPAYSWHPCNVWHRTLYHPTVNKCNKPVKSSPEPVKSSPEPTSGLLMAVGIAALALKRKDNVNA